MLQDGRTSRIGDWHKMDKFDRERTLRVITARNYKRLKKLRKVKLWLGLGARFSLALHTAEPHASLTQVDRLVN